MKHKMIRKIIQKLGMATVFTTVLLSTCACAPSATQQKEEVTLELGEEYVFSLEEFFDMEGLDEEKFTYSLREVDFATPGEYPVTITYGKQQFTVTIKIEDTTAPILKLGEDIVYTTNDINSFDVKNLVSVTDLQECEITASLVEKIDLTNFDVTLWDSPQLGDKLLAMARKEEDAASIEVEEDGAYLVLVTATDASENATSDYMIVVYDHTAPEITGLADYEVEQENVEEEPKVDFSACKVTDNLLGEIPMEQWQTEIKADADNKQVYTISISYTDIGGNTTTEKATVTVKEKPKQTTPSGSSHANAGGVNAGGANAGGANAGGANAGNGNSGSASSGSSSASAGSSSSSSADSSAATGSYKDDFANQVLALVNAERAAEGLAPLTMNASACSAAKVRAAETVVSFSHTRPSGASCFTALAESGVSYGYAGENIAAGQSSPEAVVNSWMNSEGHRANIMNPNYTQIGIGCYYVSDSTYRYYWVQLFIG